MTEKDYNPEQKQMKSMNKQKIAGKANAKNVPVAKPAEKKEEKSHLVEAEKTEEKKPEQKTEKENKKDAAEKPKTTVKERSKKDEAHIYVKDIPISTKHAAAICKFIRNRKISDALEDLEQVLKFKKAVPMKGEIPHRKGRGMMSGRFPKKASENIIRILKSVAANAVYNGIEEPVIVKAVANMGARPYGRFGAVRKKRTHIEIEVRDKIKKENRPSKAELKKKEVKRGGGK